MKHILTAQAAKANDLYTIASEKATSAQLIHLAASAVLDALQTGEYDLSNPCILAGSGNNGADGLQLAYLLKQAGNPVKVLYLGELYEQPAPTKPQKGAPAPDGIDPALIGTPKKEAMSEECLAHYEKAVSAGIEIITALPAPDKADDAENHTPDAPAFSLYVDAVFGTGMHGMIKDRRVRDTFTEINQSGIAVVAVDLPSGVNGDTGAADKCALRAAQTVTMQEIKTGLLLWPGADYAGKVTVADIGIEADPACEQPPVLSIEDEDVAALLPERPARSSKITCGRVLVVCGSAGMAGAAYMAAAAAYRAGAGLVEIVTPSKNRTVLQQLIPEAVLSCYVDKKTLKRVLKASVKRADAIVIGCGLGRTAVAKLAVARVLKSAKVPLVIDADALNVIAQKPGMLKRLKASQKAQTVITPHAAEAARLQDKTITPERVLGDVYTAADILCTKYKVNVLLKDAHTLICAHDKSCRYVNLSGNTALATAGSGDILAGLCAGLSASMAKEQTMVQTVALAAYLHGKAGEKAAEAVGERAAMARDILEGLKK